MPKIERPRRATLKGIAAVRDVLHVQVRATADDPLQRGGVEPVQCLDHFFDFGKKIGVANQSHFHSFDITGGFLGRGQTFQKITVVNNRKGRRKSADKIFFPEGVDCVFYSDASIRLAQGGGWQTNVAHAAMSGGGGEPDHIEQCAAADRKNEGMARNLCPLIRR